MSGFREWFEDEFRLTQSYNLWWCQLIGVIVGYIKTIFDSGYHPSGSKMAVVAWAITIGLVVIIATPIICLLNCEPRSHQWHH
ncbi:hypothetical protein MYOV003v1_p0081 [Vibrio phage 207E48.1]|nr:hypothetical protein MYOV003v1_p0081 [Vibrio phage 207E48.1]